MKANPTLTTQILTPVKNLSSYESTCTLVTSSLAGNLRRPFPITCNMAMLRPSSGHPRAPKKTTPDKTSLLKLLHRNVKLS